MRLLPTLLLLASAAAFSSARTVTYEVGLFDQLVQSGNINVEFKSNPDSVGLVTYDSDVDFSEAIEISNTKGKLLIKEVPGHQLGDLPTLHAYADIIYQIKSEGNAEIMVTLNAATPTLSVNLVGNGLISCRNVNTTDLSASITTGNGTVALEGKCVDANFKLTGTGTIQADQLSAQNVKCTSLGTGTIGCNPGVSLEARGLGSTKIYYSGNPTIKKLGNAKLLPLDPTPSATHKIAPTTRMEMPDDEAGDDSSEEAEEDDGASEDTGEIDEAYAI